MHARWVGSDDRPADDPGDPDRDQPGARPARHAGDPVDRGAGRLGPGDAVPGLGRLDRIGATWAEIIDGAGHRGRLSLREAAAGHVPDTAMPGTAPAAWDARIRQLDDQTYEVDRSLVRELVTGAIRPGSVRMIPQFDHGALTGIRLLGATAGSVPAAIGLASGDVLVALNSAPIQS